MKSSHMVAYNGVHLRRGGTLVFVKPGRCLNKETAFVWQRKTGELAVHPDRWWVAYNCWKIDCHAANVANAMLGDVLHSILRWNNLSVRPRQSIACSLNSISNEYILRFLQYLNSLLSGKLKRESLQCPFILNTVFTSESTKISDRIVELRLWQQEYGGVKSTVKILFAE